MCPSVDFESRKAAALAALGGTVKPKPIETSSEINKGDDNKKEKPPKAKKENGDKQGKRPKLYLIVREALSSDNMGISGDITKPLRNIFREIFDQFIANGQVTTLDSRKKALLRDLMIRSMGITRRPEQTSPVAETTLAAFYKKLLGDYNTRTFLTQPSNQWAMTSLFSYILEDPANRFEPVIQALTETRTRILETLVTTL